MTIVTHDIAHRKSGQIKNQHRFWGPACLKCKFQAANSPKANIFVVPESSMGYQNNILRGLHSSQGITLKISNLGLLFSSD